MFAPTPVTCIVVAARSRFARIASPTEPSCLGVAAVVLKSPGLMAGQSTEAHNRRMVGFAGRREHLKFVTDDSTSVFNP